MSDTLILTARWGKKDSHTLASVSHFDLAAAIAYPHRLSRIDPRHRVPVAFPRNVGIARSQLGSELIDFGPRRRERSRRGRSWGAENSARDVGGPG